MQKRILFIISIVGIAILFIAGAYYIAIFLPQNQKLNADIIKLELQTKIEQEKTEQAKIEQIKTEEETRKQEELLADKQEKEELEKKEKKENNQKNETARNTCLTSAKDSYKKMLQIIENSFNPDFSGNLTPDAIKKKVSGAIGRQEDTSKRASTNYENAKNDCYHKYPLPNEDF